MVELRKLLEELRRDKSSAEAKVDLARELANTDMEYLNLGYSMACCDYAERIEEILQDME